MTIRRTGNDLLCSAGCGRRVARDGLCIRCRNQHPSKQTDEHTEQLPPKGLDE